MTKQIKNNKYYSLNPFNKGSDQGNHNVLVNLDSFKGSYGVNAPF